MHFRQTGDDAIIQPDCIPARKETGEVFHWLVHVLVRVSVFTVPLPVYFMDTNWISKIRSELAGIEPTA